MKTRRIGSLDVSVVGLGCNNFGIRLDADATARVVHAALDAGITFFDTADIYGGTKSEVFLGKALGARRNDIVLASKFGMKVDDQRTGAHPRYVRQAIEDSLQRLDTDRIDLYQLHQPDPSVPIADTLGALDALVQAGKVREIGCSNFSVEQLREAEGALGPGSARFVSVQNHFSLLHREPEQGVLPECERAGLAFLPFFPLESGLLTGKVRRGQAPPAGSRLTEGRYTERFISEQRIEIVERLIAFAEARGHTILELAFGWLLAHQPVASVIAGATRAEQIQANVAAATWALSADELRDVDALLNAVA